MSQMSSWGQQRVQGRTAEPGCEQRSDSQQPLVILCSLLHFLICQMGTIMPISHGYCRGKTDERRESALESVSSLCRWELFLLLSHTASPQGLAELYLAQISSPPKAADCLHPEQCQQSEPHYPSGPLPMPGRSIAHTVCSLIATGMQNMAFGSQQVEGNGFPPPKFISKYFYLWIQVCMQVSARDRRSLNDGGSYN